MTESTLEEHLEQAIRAATPGGARWFDQKLTFDNVHLIASAVDLTIRSDDEWFDRFTIQDSSMLAKVLTREYGKPDVSEKTAENEYDKFIGQSLNLLANAGVLNSRKSRKRLYQVADRELLRGIASSEKGARTFLIRYLEIILRNFGFWPKVEKYLESPQTQEDLTALKNQFGQLLLETTGIGTRGTAKPATEISRIFTKVINPICFDRGAFGTENGRVMQTYPSTFDLVYNRPNFRDTASKKPKKMTRAQFEAKSAAENLNTPNPSELTAVMRRVRNYHNFQSEVPDRDGRKATHVHHIFTRSSKPRIADKPENLLVLTAGQHMQEAHPAGDTTVIDPVFQKTALFLKLESVKKSVEKGDGLYSYEGFAEVLAEGYGLAEIPPTFKDLRLAISAQEV